MVLVLLSSSIELLSSVALGNVNSFEQNILIFQWFTAVVLYLVAETKFLFIKIQEKEGCIGEYRVFHDVYFSCDVEL